MKKAFTMIELVFVIVILGILASVAVPRFAATRDDAQIAKARTTIASIRSGIVSERQSRLIAGDSLYISGTLLNTGGLFSGNGQVLMYPISDENWASVGGDTDSLNRYTYTINNVAVAFTYTRSTGIFDCNTTNTAQNVTQCKLLVD